MSGRGRGRPKRQEIVQNDKNEEEANNKEEKNSDSKVDEKMEIDDEKDSKTETQNNDKPNDDVATENSKGQSWDLNEMIFFVKSQ